MGRNIPERASRKNDYERFWLAPQPDVTGAAAQNHRKTAVTVE
jgi:hypothetical protein